MARLTALLDRAFERICDWAEKTERSVNWPAIRARLMTLLRQALIIAGVVAVLIVILYGARWSCELNPACPWSAFWTRP